MSNNVITLEKNFILYVQLNRPDKHNAFTPEMIRELKDIFVKAESQKHLRGVFLMGNGPSFCAGADLEYMKSMVNFDLGQNKLDSLELFEMFEAASQLSLPIVGRFHGNVMGGGVGLAAICDIGVALSDTKFCLSEVKLGIAPAVISSFISRRMRASWVRELALTARLFSSEEAREAGLVQFVGDESQINTFLHKTFSTLVQNGPEAVRETKKILRFVTENSPLLVKERSASVIAERRVSAEGQEGIKAFLEKRSPSWKKDYGG